MAKQKDNRTKEQLTFEEYKDALLAAIKKVFKLDQNDTRYDSDEAIRSDYDSDMSIEDCLDWMQEKDDLDRFDEFPHAPLI